MNDQPKSGINITAVALALIAAAEAIFLALIATGKVGLGGGSDQSAVGERQIRGISGDGIELKRTSRLSPQDCLQRSQQALLARGFRLDSRTDRTITVNLNEVVAIVRCRDDTIVLSAAAQSGSSAEGVVAQMRGAIREALSGDVRVE